MKKKRTNLRVWFCHNSQFKRLASLICLSLFMCFTSLAADESKTALAGSVEQMEVSAQSQRVSGNVTDENGISLPGVSIVVKGTFDGTVSDMDGNFSFSGLEGNETLVFSFVGMLSQEVAISGQSVINVQMAYDAIGIDEVVAIGYGTMRKSDLTGSVSTVSTEGFDKIPATNPLQAIQGRAAGIQITSGSGIPGSESSVLIRGASTIRGTNSPIFVVDGVITNSITHINPNNIESVSVLKDAAASAIYGARASNGVVLVTTKRGQTGDPTISFNSYLGLQGQGNLRIKQLNSTDYLQLLTEAYENDGTTLPWANDPELLNQYDGVDTDWNSLMLQTGVVQNYDLSVSGGSAKSNYFISASHLDHKGMVIETAYKKTTLTLNSDHKIKSWIKFGNSLNIYTSTQNNPGSTRLSPYEFALMKTPISRAYEDDGDFGRIRHTSLEHNFPNPLILAANNDRSTVRNGLQGNLYITLNLLKGLEFTTRGSANYNTSFRSQFNAGMPAIYGSDESAVSSMEKEYRESLHWITDYLLNYNTNIGSVHSISALLGYSREESSTENLFGSGTNTPFNYIRYLDAVDPTSYQLKNSFTDWAFASVFGRVNYDFDNKYLLSATVRRDGSSRLSGDNRYGVYPSGSFAWRISQESFMQNMTWLDDLKVRASIGTLGNVQSVGLYATSASLASRKAVLGQSPAVAYTMASAINQDLKWETAVKKNLGLDFVAFNSMLYGTVNLFIEDTYDLLFSDPIPVSSGLAGQPFINAGQVRNSGFEIETGYRVSKGDWSYDFNLNLSHVKNEVVDLNERDLRTSGLVEGYPVNSFFGYKTDGLITSEDQLDKYTSAPFANKKIGDIHVLDIDGYDEDGNLTGQPDGKVDAADRAIIGNRYPNFIFGGMGTVSYKNVSFQVQIQGVQGVDLYYGNTGAYSLIHLMTSWARNEDGRLINRYHPENNPDGYWPRLSQGDTGGNLQRSDFWLEDASYLRINNINLNYNVPKSVISLAGIDQLGVYVSIQNAYTFTNYGGPEVDTTVDALTGVPQPRTITFGVKALF